MSFIAYRQLSPCTEISCFEARDIQYSVPNRVQPILHGISLSAKSGQTLGIMGPSGAGKTSLLKCVTLDALGGTTTGSVTINGIPLDNEAMRKYCYFVDQEVRPWRYLTARETLSFAASFYQETVDKDFVNQILANVGLTDRADVIVGGGKAKGLSGGQKRRLAIAIGLVKRPLVLFLDEPTTGLDSAAARVIMQHLTELAHKHNLIVILTIHQPNVKVFLQMDHVIMLSQGRAAYSGNPKDIVQYLSDIKFPNPDMTNPADYFLELTNHEFSSKQDVNKVIDKWENCDLKTHEPSLFSKSKDFLHVSTNPLWNQISVLNRRVIVSIKRDPASYTGKALLFFLINLLFSFIFFKSREVEQKKIIGRLYMIMILSSFNCLMFVITVHTTNMYFPMVRREIKSGMYSSGAYHLSQLFFQLPFMFLLAVLALGIPGFVVSKLYINNILWFFLVQAILYWSFDSFALLLGVSFRDSVIGMISYLQLWAMNLMFSASVVNIKKYIWPFRGLSYISFQRWGNEAFMYLEYKYNDYSSCTGFIPECWGNTGEEILRRLSIMFGPFESKSFTPFKDMLIVGSMGLILYIIYCIVFEMNVSSSSEVQPRNNQQSEDQARSIMVYDPSKKPIP